MKKFPAEIFVIRDGAHSLLSYDSLKSLNEDGDIVEGEVVGVYKFVSVKKISKNIHLCDL